MVTGTAEGGVTVRESDTWSEYTTVTANSINGKTGKGYTIRFVTAIPGEPVGKQQIKPVGVKASSVPQPENSPENSIDGFETHNLFGQSARYVRINMYGYNYIKTNWNSLLDVKFYTE